MGLLDLYALYPCRFLNTEALRPQLCRPILLRTGVVERFMQDQAGLSLLADVWIPDPAVV